MSTRAPESVSDTTRNQKLGIAAATICFLIGFWHTGLGLASWKVLSSEYGGFVIAAGIVILMILSYSNAIRGSKVGLAIYLAFALITFICNLNSFYPSYRSDPLIREELRDHRAKLADLKESVNAHFKDVKLEELSASVDSMKRQLVEQIKQRGFGPRAEDDLKKIEAALGRPAGSITRLKLGRVESEWENIAKQYDGFIDAELRTVLTGNRYLDKREIIRMADDDLDVFSRKIDESLLSKQSITRVPSYVEDLVKEYREICKKAVAIANTADKGKPFEACSQKYSSSNIEMGTFSHTFKSAWSTISDGGTITVLLITLFIDFVFPLAIYLLVRRHEFGNRGDSGIWTIGGREIRPRSDH